ncbi:MAG: PIN domain-containing protein [Methylococcaceae bacterium]|nr:PIN domain-containing protein [Methylococcaceae bacterium]
MKLLPDTHAFIWLNDNPEKLPETVTNLCNAGTHEFYLSIASPWEMQIKNQLGKLTLAMPVAELVNKNIEENNLKLLSINLSHISQLEQLPTHHKDPFDRIIIAQTMIEEMTVISVDGIFKRYEVQTVW